MPQPAPEPILEHQVSGTAETTLFNPDIEPNVQTAITEIQKNMGEQSPMEQKKLRTRKSHSPNPSRSHKRGTSDASNDSYGSQKSNGSNEGGQDNKAFESDDTETKGHKRQESGVSIASDITSASELNAKSLHKTRYETIGVT